MLISCSRFAPVSWSVNLNLFLLTHLIPYISGKLNVGEIFFEVPKDYDKSNKGTLRVFARSVERYQKPVDPCKTLNQSLDSSKQPWCRYIHIQVMIDIR